MNEQKKFDFIVFGASGFTGKLVVEYIVSKYGQDNTISWAMAGRNLEKLEAVKAEKGVSDNISIIQVDSDDVESINKNKL